MADDKSPHLTIDMDAVEELQPEAEQNQEETDKASGSASPHQIIEIEEAPAAEAPAKDAPVEDAPAEEVPIKSETPVEEFKDEENLPKSSVVSPTGSRSGSSNSAILVEEAKVKPEEDKEEDQSNEEQPKEDNNDQNEDEKPKSPHHTIQMDEVEDFKSEVNETEEPKEETKPDDAPLNLEIADLEEIPDEEPLAEAALDIPDKTPSPIPGTSSSRASKAQSSLSSDILVENLEIYSQSTEKIRPVSVTSNAPHPLPVQEETPDQEASRFMVMLVAWLCMCEANLPHDSFTQMMDFPTLKLLLSVTSREQQELVRKMFTNRIGDEKIAHAWDRRVKKVLRGYEDSRKKSIDESMLMEEAFD